MASPLFGPAPAQNPLAQALLQQGASTAPVQSAPEGIFRALTGALGGWLGGNSDREYREGLASALKAGQGWKSPDNIYSERTGEMVSPAGQVAPGTGGTDAMVAALMGTNNPQLANLGLGLQLQGIQNQSEYEKAANLERLKASLKPREPVSGVGKIKADLAAGIITPEQADAAIKKETAGAEPPNEVREYQFAVTQGYKGTFADFQKEMKAAGASRTNVTVGNEKYGTIPPGYMLRETPEGAVMVPIPGGPAALEIADKNKKSAAADAGKTRTAGLVSDDIDRVIKLTNEATFPVTGFGSLLKGVPGSAAKDTEELINTIKANVGFDKLQAMREQSPTGGALGPVSDFENKSLQSVVGSLEQSQSKEQFLYNLNRLKDLYLDVIHGPGNRPDAPSTSAPAGTASPPGVPKPPTVGQVMDGWRFKGGNPADKNSWEQVR